MHTSFPKFRMPFAPFSHSLASALLNFFPFAHICPLVKTVAQLTPRKGFIFHEVRIFRFGQTARLAPKARVLSDRTRVHLHIFNDVPHNGSKIASTSPFVAHSGHVHSKNSLNYQGELSDGLGNWWDTLKPIPEIGFSHILAVYSDLTAFRPR
jgi:hypothetical protein